MGGLEFLLWFDGRATCWIGKSGSVIAPVFFCLFVGLRGYGMDNEARVVESRSYRLFHSVAHASIFTAGI